MGKQIRFDDAARESLRRGVDQLAGAVRLTLGPRGRNVLIDHLSGSPTITNDGLTIAREIELENPFENMGAQLVKEVAIKTGQAAGDGTTTATVLAHSMVSRGLQAIAAGHNPMGVKRGMDQAVRTAVDELRKQSRQVRNRGDLSRIATISANDDSGVGKMIAEAMERVGGMGVITVQEGRGMATTLDVVEGVRLGCGYLSPYFVTDAESMDVVLENVLVLLTESKLTSAKSLLPALERAAQAGRSLLVVAEDIEGEALATLVINRLRGTLNTVAVRAPATGDRRRELLEDLATLTGGCVFTNDLGRSLEKIEAADFGRVRRALIDHDTTTLVEGGGGTTQIRERVARLKRELDACDSDYDREWLRERLGRLTGGVAVIQVGASTEIEMAARKACFEDALAATRSAVEEGIVAGGGVALLRTQSAVRALRLPRDEHVGLEIVYHALEEPLRQIAINAGQEGRLVVERIRAEAGTFGFNALTGEFGDLEEFGILDPTKVTRCALQHAASIGSLVLTTDAIVVDGPGDEEPAPPGG